MNRLLGVVALLALAAIVTGPALASQTVPGRASSSARPSYRRFVTPGPNGENCEIGLHAPRPGPRTYVTCGANRPRRPYRTYLKVTMRASGKLTFCRGCISNSGPVPTLKVGRSIRFGPFRCTSLHDGVRCVLTKTGHGFRQDAHGVTRI